MYSCSNLQNDVDEAFCRQAATPNMYARHKLPDRDECCLFFAEENLHKLSVLCDLLGFLALYVQGSQG